MRPPTYYPIDVAKALNVCKFADDRTMVDSDTLLAATAGIKQPSLFFFPFFLLACTSKFASTFGIQHRISNRIE